MPRPRPRPQSAGSPPDPAAALLLWLIRDGTPALVGTIHKQLRLVKRALLLWLAKWYQSFTLGLISPLWQKAHTVAISLLHSKVTEVCWRLVQSWLTNLKAARSRLHSAASKSQSSPEKQLIDEADTQCSMRTPVKDIQQLSTHPLGSVPNISSAVSSKGSSPRGSEKSPLRTPPRREPLPGNWSSVSLLNLSVW